MKRLSARQVKKESIQTHQTAKNPSPRFFIVVFGCVLLFFSSFHPSSSILPILLLRKVEWYGWYEEMVDWCGLRMSREDKEEEKKKTHHSRWCGIKKRRINNPPSSSISLLVLLDGLSTTLPSSDLPLTLYFFPHHGAAIQLQHLRLLLE